MGVCFVLMPSNTMQVQLLIDDRGSSIIGVFANMSVAAGNEEYFLHSLIFFLFLSRNRDIKVMREWGVKFCSTDWNRGVGAGESCVNFKFFFLCA